MSNYAEVLFVNVGSAGRPKDADTRAGYTTIDVASGGEPVVEVVRVSYDVEKTASGVEAVGLPPALAEAFRAGK